MKATTVPYFLTVLILIGAAFGVWKWWQVEQYRKQQFSGGIQHTGPPLQEFELTESSGKPFRSEDMRGKVWVTSLFFSTCPGSCKKLNANIKQFHDRDDLKDVTWVSISVDPVTDTPPVLRAYAESLNADPERWLFCRGDFAYVKRIGQDILGLPVLWKDHNDYGVVIDKAGHVRGAYDINRTSHHKRLINLIKECLAEDLADLENKDEASDESSEPELKEAA